VALRHQPPAAAKSASTRDEPISGWGSVAPYPEDSMKRSFLREFETALTVSGKAPSTVRTYTACVRDFLEFAGVSLSRLRREHVAQFLVHLAEQRRHEPSTVKTYVYAIRFLFEATLARADVVENLKAPRVTPKPIIVLSPDEVLKFFDAFDSPVYRTIACLIYATGLRIGEALALTVHDVDAKRGVIAVHKTKVRRPRFARLSKALLDLLRNYWRRCRPPLPLLFPGLNPTVPLNQSTIQGAFQVAARDAGLHKPVTPHVLRHTYATHLLEGGVDIHTVQLLLGHANIAATLRYLHVSTAHLAGRTIELHPLLADR